MDFQEFLSKGLQSLNFQVTQPKKYLQKVDDSPPRGRKKLSHAKLFRADIVVFNKMPHSVKNTLQWQKKHITNRNAEDE